MRFYFKAIDEMTGREAFCVESLRNEVFVSEQKITVPEIDDEDFYAIHVFTLNKSNDNALATCRIFKDKNGVDRLYCHAQMTAKPFYDYLGYQVKGNIFNEAGIDHILMYKDL